MFHAVTLLAFVLHIAAGTVGLAVGVIAVSVRKGGYLHRKAGSVFVLSMVVMAVFACYLAIAIPSQIVNVFISVFALYLILTAWLAVRRKDRSHRRAKKFALFVGVCLCAPFVALSFQLATGLPPVIKSAVPLKGPVLIAIYAFATVLAIAAIGDARLVLSGGVVGVSRISRHLWRMCLGLTLALGSGFTNSLARLLPGPYHVPTIFFLPQLLPLALIAFWLIRVRSTDWLRRTAAVGQS